MSCITSIARVGILLVFGVLGFCLGLIGFCLFMAYIVLDYAHDWYIDWRIDHQNAR